MRWILVGLAMTSLSCATRVGSGSLSASNIPLTEGYMPKTRLSQKACNLRFLGLVPIGDEVGAGDLQQRMARGANGLADIVVENENYFAFLLTAHCVSVTATPVNTGGSDAQ